MIDHLVYLVPDLEAAAQSIGRALGVRFSPGGRHPDRGTKNVLLRIGPKTYFELMAADPDNKTFAGARWMGVDHLPAGVPGRLSRWGLAVNAAELVAQAPLLEATVAGAGTIQPGSRRLADGSTLRWQLTDPGTEAIRTLPFLIDWGDALTPAERLPEVGCRLTLFSVASPETDRLKTLCRSTPEVEIVAAERESLRAEITGPGGRISLTD